jgi:hypothetical protein
MRKTLATTLILLVLSVATFGGEIPGTGRQDPDPTPSPTPTATSTTTSTSTSTVTTLILTLISLIR